MIKFLYSFPILSKVIKKTLSIYIMHFLAETRRHTKFMGLVLIPTEDPPTEAPVLLMYIH